MEILIEFLLELIFEGTFELSKSKKVPKWIRYPLIILIVSFFTAIITVIFLLGVSLYDKSLLGSMFIVAISVLLAVLGVVKFKKVYLKKQKEDIKNL